MDKLIELVKQKQREKELSDTALATLLGIHRSTWAKIKSGTRSPGIKFLRAVNDKLMPVEISDNLTTIPSERTQDGKLGRLRGWLRERVRGVSGSKSK